MRARGRPGARAGAGRAMSRAGPQRPARHGGGLPGALRRALLPGVALATGAVLLLLLAAAWAGFPLPAGDQDYFLPVAAALAAGEGFRHPFFSPLPEALDTAYTWHGWLMPLLHAALLPAGGYERALVPAALLAPLAVAAWALLLRPAGPVFVAAALPVLAVLAVYQSGRPELPGSLLLALLMAGQRLGPAARDALAAVAIGLLAVTSLPLAAAGGLLHGIAAGQGGPARLLPLALRTGLVALGALLLAALLTRLATGTDPGTWLEGHLAHARMIAARTDTGGLLHYALLQPRMPGLAVLFLLLPVWFLAILRRTGPGWWLLPAGLLLLWLWLMALRVPPTIYNGAALVPAILAGLARAGPAPGAARLATGLTGLAGLFAALALAGQALTAAEALARGVRAEAVRAALRALPDGTRVAPDRVAHAMLAREVLGPARVAFGGPPPPDAVRLLARAYAGPEAATDGPGACPAPDLPWPQGPDRKDWAFRLAPPCPPERPRAAAAP